MYDDHYGLNGRPFQLTPDPRFWFDTATHRKAMAYLGYGLSQGEGFIVITGDVGAGKTTLVGHLMATIDRDRLHALRIVSTQIEADDLLRMVGNGLDLRTDGMTKAQLLTAIERALHTTARSGRRTLLIVDEAQALPVSALEELRMLSNFQAGGHALLQIFLLGQPEFRDRLHGSDRLEQLRQRVIATHHLEPMEREEVAPYMKHRLGVVGWSGRPQFTDDAFAALYDGSNGVPRRLNQLAGRVLLAGAIEQTDTIDAAVVNTVLADIANDVPERPEPLPIVKPSESTMPPRPIRHLPIEDGLPDTALLARIASLESRVEEPAAPDQSLMQAIASIESRLENVSAGSRVDRGILARLTSLEARVENAPKLDIALGERLASVEGRTDQIADAVSDVDQTVRDALAAIDAASSERIGALEARIDDLAARVPQSDPAVADHLESLEAAMEQLAARSADPDPAIAARLDALEARIDETVAVAATGDPASRARIASLEARVEEQDAALRRVLTLLVDWVEGDGSHDSAALRRDLR
ncbi:XrtA/PEP-CTERM system-associated ATPase [Sphingomonas sp. NFR15]|uniref:XrtA/PEP-CTERM system-associated ATPase n=1 Tax=Sphingomonas sp. NFR15 TaxID=1566282 RepID=UPI000888B3C5|nr:XrtA/PEP-CTERM system-associated ATPase [Sphingomonas sp. NFR15]SDA29174.1 putative secretion ATPase, PEP-CTERM locus subfamily [Sphingomonas sp. NFR15]